MSTSKTILIVEDNEDLLTLYVELLETEGYKVTQAEAGDIALEIPKKNKKAFDLFLVDELIPKIQGTELIQIIKDSKDIIRPKNIVLMTNLDKASIESKIKKLKCNLIRRYILKSELTPMEFTEEINKILS